MILDPIIALLAQIEGVQHVRGGGGVYELVLTDGTSREATQAEILPAAQAQMAATIRADCERRQFTEGVPFGGVRWQSDEKSRGRYAMLQGFATLALMQGATMESPVADPSTGQTVNWNAMGGVSVPLTVGLLLGMLQAAAGRENACDTRYRQHVAALNELTDPAAVLAYDFSTGWPA